MTKRIGIRELTRNSSILDEADYIEIVDKKTKKLKGAFISEKYLDGVKSFIEEKEKLDRKNRFEKMLKLLSDIEIEDRFKDKSYKEIREMIAKEKCGQ
jgi:hypothetical protein